MNDCVLWKKLIRSSKGISARFKLRCGIVKMSSNANEDASPVNVGNVGRKYGKIAAEISKLSDEEMMDVLAQQPIELFTKFKELDEEIAKRFYSVLSFALVEIEEKRNYASNSVNFPLGDTIQT